MTAPQNAHHPPKVASTTGQESEAETLELDKNRLTVPGNRVGSVPGLQTFCSREGPGSQEQGPLGTQGDRRGWGSWPVWAQGWSAPPCPVVTRMSTELCAPHPRFLNRARLSPASFDQAPLPPSPTRVCLWEGDGNPSCGMPGRTLRAGGLGSHTAQAPSWSPPPTIQEFGQLAQQGASVSL